MVAISMVTIFFLQSDYLGLDENTGGKQQLAGAAIFVTVVVAISGFAVALMTGWIVKILRTDN